MQIKICGITRPEDARTAVALGVDAIGLVLWPGSRRAVDLEGGRGVAAACGPLTTLVALLVDPEPGAVEQALTELPVNLIQWHGNEAPEFCEQWGFPYLRALKVSRETDIRREMDRYPNARGFLLDTDHGGQFGGTGRVFDWGLVTGDLGRPIILAGGLNPANVAEGIRAVRPDAVDVSSGVEVAPGVKDRDKMQQFVEAARAATEVQK